MSAASCSTEGSRAIGALADQVGKSGLVRQDARTSSSASPSIRAPVAHRSEADWQAFARPLHPQLGASPASSFGGSASPNTLADWLDKFHHADGGEVSEGHASDSDVSWRWAPEIQTSAEVSRTFASSPALSASSYDCPTPEEVRAFVLRSQPTDLGRARRSTSSARLAHRAVVSSRDRASTGRPATRPRTP